jgi:hypothetical protein
MAGSTDFGARFGIGHHRYFGGSKVRNIYRVACIPTGEFDNGQQDVENWVGEEKANTEMLRFCLLRLAMNYGR